MKEYFIIEQNPLSGSWMVYSKCDQLPQCFAGKKQDMLELKDRLNEKCAKDEHRVPFPLTWKD